MLKPSQTISFAQCFGDYRLERRAILCQKAMDKSMGTSVLKVSKNRAFAKGFYGFLKNPKVSECGLISSAVGFAGQNCFGKDLIIYQDTSEFNLQKHARRIKHDEKLGVISNGWSLGYFMHVSLVYDGLGHDPIGYSDIQLWNRSSNAPTRNERHYRTQSIQEKESYKWIKGVESSIKNLPFANSYTFVQDRDGDIFEQFAFFETIENATFIIRGRGDRARVGGGLLKHILNAQKIDALVPLTIVVKDSNGRSKKQSHSMRLKYCSVKLRRPKSVRTHAPYFCKVNVVQVQSIQDPSLKWIVYTNKNIDTIQEAISVIKVYRNRWSIEQLFRILKSEGFNLENSELETAGAIRKLTLLCMNSAILIKKMRNAWIDPDPKDLLSNYFNEDQIKCLKILNKEYQGKTEKQKNPFSHKSLDWASWVIARLGGWQGYMSQRNPGLMTLRTGLNIFTQIYTGYSLARDVGKH